MTFHVKAGFALIIRGTTTAVAYLATPPPTAMQATNVPQESAQPLCYQTGQDAQLQLPAFPTSVKTEGAKANKMTEPDATQNTSVKPRSAPRNYATEAL